MSGYIKNNNIFRQAAKWGGFGFRAGSKTTQKGLDNISERLIIYEID